MHDNIERIVLDVITEIPCLLEIVRAADNLSVRHDGQHAEIFTRFTVISFILREGVVFFHLVIVFVRYPHTAREILP